MACQVSGDGNKYPIIGGLIVEFPHRKPQFSKELLNFLSEQYPDILPRQRDITLTELAFLQGQRSVVDYLLQLYEQED